VVQNRKPKPFLLQNLKWFALGLLLVTLAFIYFIPRAITHSDYPAIGWMVFPIIFFVIPALLFIVLIAFTKHPKMSTAIAIGSVLLIGPTFGLFQEYRDKLELQKFGTWTKAVLIDRELLGKRGREKWTAKYQYVVNKMVYQTNYHNNEQKQFAIGDTIDIIYSKDFPKIYALGNEWKK
jgi:hypothetical protein